MSDEIYTRLRKHIDSMPAGFPDTGTGSEIKMLKKFYTHRQAEIALVVGPLPEKAEDIAARLGDTPEKTIIEIEQMATEGCLFRMKTSKGTLYSHPNFIMGLYEWHINKVDKEVATYADDIYEGMFEHHWKGRETKQLRIVPVESAIDSQNSVNAYDAIRELVRGSGKGPFVVAPCICRVEAIKKGIEVKRPMDTCLTFGMVAKYYLDNGIGKQLTEDELMAKLDECEEASLVPFSTNSQKISNMCMCDKDTCQLFRNLRNFDKPAVEVHAAFYAKIEGDLCEGCKKCRKKCQMDAIVPRADQTDNKLKIHVVNLDRCIGCGLCISVCETKAIRMVQKNEIPDVPKDPMEMMMRISEERSKVNQIIQKKVEFHH